MFPTQISLAAQIPHAVGFAWGQRLRREPGVVAAFVGDGATSEGDFYEAMNFAGVLRAPVVFVIVNNHWAISTPLDHQSAVAALSDKAAAAGFPGVQVDGRDPVQVHEAVAAARQRALDGDGPTLIECVTYRLGPHTTADDPGRYVPPDELAGEKARDPLLTFGRRLDGAGTVVGGTGRGGSGQGARPHRRGGRPGRGRRAAPRRLLPPRLRRPAARAAPAPGRGGGRRMAVMTLVEAVNRTLAAEMARDERVVVFGQDVGVNGGVFRATDGLQARFGAERVVDTPLAEGVIVGTAVGLAAAGMVPVAEIQFLGFIYQAMHQLAGQVARLRYRSNGRFDVPITIRAPFGGGVRTPELHSDALEGQLANVPGLKIALPSCPADAAGLLASAIRDPDPVLVLEPLRGYRTLRGEVPDEDHLVPFGRLRRVRDGDDLVIVAWSYMVEIARRAAEALEEDGFSVGVVDLRTVSPLDVAGLAEAVAAAGRVVVVEEAPMTAGFGAEVIATVNEECFYDLEAPPVRVSGYDVPYPVGMLEDRYVPSVDRVVRACRRALEALP